MCARTKNICAHIQLPSNSPKPMLIQYIRHWQGINSRIKGHSKQGMKKIQAQHRNYENVAIVNEFNISKICHIVFSNLFFIVPAGTLMKKSRLFAFMV